MNTISSNLKSKRVDYEDLINYILNKYEIDGVTLNIYEDNKMVDMFSTKDMEMIAILNNPVPKTFALFVRKGGATPEIICHEMIHLWQYDRGDLQMLDNGRKYIWKGFEYTVSTLYNDREWEKEAFKGMYKLWREYRKYKKTLINKVSKNK